MEPPEDADTGCLIGIAEGSAVVAAKDENADRAAEGDTESAKRDSDTSRVVSIVAENTMRVAKNGNLEEARNRWADGREERRVRTSDLVREVDALES